MIEVKNQPTTGQFIQVWEYGGQIWAEPLKWVDDILMRLNIPNDSWEPNIDWKEDDDKISNVRYFVK